jgi:hypothetical protein
MRDVIRVMGLKFSELVKCSDFHVENVLGSWLLGGWNRLSLHAHVRGRRCHLVNGGLTCFFVVIGLVDSVFIPMFVGGVKTLAVPLFSAAASLWQVLHGFSILSNCFF